MDARPCPAARRTADLTREGNNPHRAITFTRAIVAHERKLLKILSQAG
jgi:hypothetical protein